MASARQLSGLSAGAVKPGLRRLTGAADAPVVQPSYIAASSNNPQTRQDIRPLSLLKFNNHTPQDPFDPFGIHTLTSFKTTLCKVHPPYRAPPHSCSLSLFSFSPQD
ncbi:hypothetical protein PGT21_018988 [Puccinia graminis f. sp. tritici]|uniref:Uncharacterized protein n=1 Tax=Puccinia graminis f. sp. tritici TaxID=56615 RepID=A0A5B0SFC1_PUCGR|nr:hypothetical protein PGT21_018988 [Puccinia graminis f. sp. tritici]KAA1136185.1 hypothetical protein PGTUg99_034515 [Puccinia graminis f. sp. tritici]